jgi:RNA-directed DNA polymerase
LNPILIGWTNYYKRVSAKDTFNYVAHELWKALWRWCLWRHPTKSKDWVRRRYFGNRYGGGWCFQAIVPKSNGVQVLKLFNLNSIPIERHVKVRGNASPDNPDLTEYWTNRETRGTSRLLHPRRIKSAKEA